MNDIGLKPCPFCGSDDVFRGQGPEGEHYVLCWGCSAKVETYNGMEDAVNGWNRRAIDRDELLKIADECEQTNINNMTDWAERIRKAVGL